MRTSGGADGETNGAHDGAVLSALRALTEISELDDFPIAALAILGDLVAFDVASYNEVDPEGERFVSITAPEGFTYPPGVYERFLACIDEHPLVQATARGEVGALRLSDFVDRAAYQGSRLYRDVYRELGVEFQVALDLPTRPPLVVAFALSRTTRDFTDAECQILATLRPHLAHTFDLLRRIERLRRLAGRDHGRRASDLVAWHADGSLVTLQGLPSPVVERWLPVGSPLRRDLEDWVTTRTALAGANGGSEAAGNEPFFVRGLDATLVVRLISTLPDAPPQLLVEDRFTDLDRLEELGLTAREAEVFSLVLDDASPRAIASGLRIAKSTVDKHLERIYRKLGAADRQEAVATALSALQGN